MLNFNLNDLLVALLLGSVIYWWWHGMGVRDRVLVFTRRYCRQLGYQLLDQTLVFRGWRLLKDGERRRLCRRYTFDVSTTGDNRFSGEIAVWGKHIIRVLLDTDGHTDITDYPLR